MSSDGVRTPALARVPHEPFGPAQVSHWSAEAEFGLLGTYSKSFGRNGESDPWTLSYEESIFVSADDAWVVELSTDGARAVRASAGELITIHKGATVRYGSAVGTRPILSITPVDWEAS